jgi:hypothetical protein
MASHYSESLIEEDNSDFIDDIKRIKYIKRLLSKYSNGGPLKTRLMINHIIILSNTLGPFATTRILLYKIEPIHHEVLSTFLHKLDMLGDFLVDEMGIDEDVINLIDKEMR